MPNSTYNVKVLDIISPENATLPQNIKIAVSGGVVSMEEYVNTLDLETKEKTKTDKLSKKDLQKLVMISSESYYELEQEGHGAPGADPFAFPPGGVDQLPAAGEHLLPADHVAVDGDRVVAGEGVGQGGGIGVHAHHVDGGMDAEIEEDCQQDGGHSEPGGKGTGFHGVDLSLWQVLQGGVPLQRVLPVGEVHHLGGAHRRDGVLIDEVLLAVCGEDHGKGVEARDGAPHLEAVHQEHGHRRLIAPDAGQEHVLEIGCFCHK